MNHLKGVISVLLLSLLFFSFTSVSYGAIKIDRAGFMDHKVNFMKFRICLLSDKGDLLVGMEEIDDLTLRKAGNMYAVHILKLDMENNKLTSWKTAYANVVKFNQVILSDKGDKLLIIGDGGTKLFVLDTNSMEMKCVFKHEKGKAGFRSEPIGMYYEGFFYVKGYFYDEEQYSQGGYIAKVDITKTGAAAFEKNLNIDELYTKLDGIVASLYIVSPVTGYFSVVRKEGIHLIAYKDGELKEIDKGFDIPDIAGAPSRVIYNVIKSKKATDETKLFDFKTGKSISLGSYIPYSFIARTTGKVVVMAKFDYARVKMSFYFAKEDDKFQVKPLFENVDPGSFKLSADGHVYAYLSKNLIIDKL
jgi:hypothetical protein